MESVRILVEFEEEGEYDLLVYLLDEAGLNWSEVG